MIKNEGKSGHVVKYKASSPLILSGSLKTVSEAKCYHGLMVLAQLAGWKYDERGTMRVSLYQLDKLTGGTCKGWIQYRDTLTKIRDSVRLDWGHLSEISRGRFNRSGSTPILSEVYVNLDLSGEPVDVVFRIPADLLEDVIRPSWFGQVNPAILFRLKSNYAFHAYLFACLTVIEKDSRKNVFFSKALTIDEWRSVLGVPDVGSYRTPSQFEDKILKRVEKQIEKMTAKTEEPLLIEFEETRRRVYQMRVERLPVKKIEAPKTGSTRKKAEAESVRIDQERAAEAAAEAQKLKEAIAAHPRAHEIISAFGGSKMTWFNWSWEVAPKLGIDTAELKI